jgi:hypothetical protein
MAAPVLQIKRGLLANLPGLRAGEPGFTTDSYDLYVGIDSTTTNNKFFGSHRYWTRGTATTGSGVNLVEGTNNGSQYLTLKAPDSLSGIATYQFPDSTDGSAGDYLKLTSYTAGVYALEWAPVPSGSFTITGDTGTDTFTTGETLTFAGTAAEIETSITNNQVQIGLPNNVVVSGILTASSGIRANNVRIGTNGSGTIDTLSGDLTLNSASGTTIIDDAVTIQNNLTVNGNVTVGGTTITLRGQDVYIENKDIVLGYTTSITPNDDTANHAGVSIASTVGSPLANFTASGINTLPNTYKQLMWFKSGTLGFSTDAFAFNYGVAIGTTTMANGVRLAVGSGVTISDTAVSASNFYGTFNGTVSGNAATASYASTAGIATYANTAGIATYATNAGVATYAPTAGVSTYASTAGIATYATNAGVATYAPNAGISTQVKTVTASDLAATHYLTFVNSHNGTATEETVYTDDGIFYNPGTNTFTTQNALFTNNVTVAGTLTGTATTATRAQTVDTTTTSTNSYFAVPFVSNVTGTNGETVRVGAALSVNPSTGDIRSKNDIVSGSGYLSSPAGTRSMFMFDTTGDVSFQGKVIANNFRSSSNSNNTLTLTDLDASFARNLIIAGIATVGTGVGITQFSAAVGTGVSASSVPTSKAVIDYVGTQIAAVDVTLGLTADSGGPSTVNTSQTLTLSGTANEIETAVSGQTVTIGLPNSVTVTTALTTPTVKATNIQANDGTSAITINNTTGNVSVASSLTVNGDLTVLGSQTIVNTTQLQVEDNLIDLALINSGGSLVAPTSDANIDVGVLFNYYTTAAKKAAVFWDDSTGRIGIASDITVTNNVVDTVTAVWAPIEIGSLWVNDCAGQSQVINCAAGIRSLENITIDGGAF